MKNNIFPFFFLIYIFLMQDAKSQDKIIFGNKSFSIPAPKGTYEITRLNKKWENYANNFATEESKILGLYVTKEGVEKLKSSDYFEIIGNYYYLSIDRQYEYKSSTTKGFDGLKQALRNQSPIDNENTLEVNKYLTLNADSMAKIFEDHRKLQIGDKMDLGVFNETQNSICLAFIAKRKIDINGVIGYDYMTSLLGCINVNGAILFVTGYSKQGIKETEDNFLEWVNNISKNNH